MTVKKTTRKQAGRHTTQQVASSTDNLNPIWVFDKIDRNGKFAFDVNRQDFDHKEILAKMIDYESMTWSEIKQQTHDHGKSKHHLLSGDGLSDEAKDRLRSLNLEESSDTLFSFALQNLLRVIGIRDKNLFHVLWYDPKHEVYPSSK